MITTIIPKFITAVGSTTDCAIETIGDLGDLNINITDVVGSVDLVNNVAVDEVTGATATFVDNQGNEIDVTAEYESGVSGVVISAPSLLQDNYITVQIVITSGSYNTYNCTFRIYGYDVTLPLYIADSACDKPYPTFAGIAIPNANKTAIYYTTSQDSYTTIKYENTNGYILSTQKNFILYTSQEKSITCTTVLGDYSCAKTIIINHTKEYTLENVDCNTFIFTNDSEDSVLLSIHQYSDGTWVNITPENGEVVTNVTVLANGHVDIDISEDGIYKFIVTYPVGESTSTINYLRVVSCTIDDCWKSFLDDMICECGATSNCDEEITCKYIGFFTLVQTYFQLVDNMLDYEYYIDVTTKEDTIYTIDKLITKINNYCLSC